MPVNLHTSSRALPDGHSWNYDRAMSMLKTGETLEIEVFIDDITRRAPITNRRDLVTERCAAVNDGATCRLIGVSRVQKRSQPAA